MFQGVSQAKGDFVKDKESLIRLWCHECMRVFGDRLINNEDRGWFSDMLQSKVIGTSSSKIIKLS